MPSKKVRSGNLRTWGHEYIQSVTDSNPVIASLKKDLIDYRYDNTFIEDVYAWLSCGLALRAASLGNFGVGSLMVDENGDMVAWGHNEVFKPYFASDRHAEMVAMDSFEDEHKNAAGIKRYRLFTSIESCPMCLLRLINSGIGTVAHVALDAEGGMQHRMDNLPPAWLKLAAKQAFRPAACSSPLVGYADKIFQSNLDALYRKIEQR